MAMGLISQITLLARGKVRARLDRLESPREDLEHSYQEQRRQLAKVKRSLVAVATSRAQLERQALRLYERIPLWEAQAERALRLGREDLAREVLQRKHTALTECAGLKTQVAEIGDDEQRLTSAQQQLASRIEGFRTQKGILLSVYSSAEARIKAAEALSGIAGELAELSIAVGRAEDKTRRLQARAGALDALIETDALAPPWGVADALGQELRRLASAQAVKAELAELKLHRGPELQLGCCA
jgi:phage shock protein A